MMKNKLDIDWLAVSQQGATEQAVDRLRRVVDFFDQLNLTAESELPGKFWCGLEVYEPIASGTFGTLYRAYDPHLQREVALKLLDQNTPGASDWLEEARRLARIRHPNVVAILGATNDSQHAGIWMELSNGEALELLISRPGFSHVDQALKIGEALADALCAMHERDLVHGDIKASNVLIEPSGRILLLDFGAATEHGEPVDQASPRTAAPEQLIGRKADPAADIWSLGTLLYRCLSGQQPYKAKNVDALAAAQRRPPELSVLPRLFRPLIGEMLSIDPTQRPTASQVVNQLRSIRKAPARRRKNIALTGIATSLLIGMIVASIGWLDAYRANLREQQASEQARATLQIFQDVIGASFGGTHGRDARIIDVLEQAERQLTLDDAQPAYIRAMVHYVVGASYLDLGRESVGLALLDDSLALLADSEEEHRESIAQVLIKQGLARCNENAATANETAAEIRRLGTGHLPPNHRVFAAALKIEACAAQRLGEDALAELRLRDAMELRPPEQYPADIAAIGTVYRLGGVLLDQRRVSEALPLLEQARSQFLALLGPSHATTLSTASALAAALLENSRFDDAVDLLEETLPEVEARTGKESLQWIATGSTLATALARAGDPARALDLNDQVIATATDQLGPTHSYTLTARTNRGIRLKELGRLDDAELAMAQTATSVERTIGTDHPLALINHVNRVEVLTMLSRAPEAVALGRRTLSTAQDALGSEHGITAGAQAYLARGLAAEGALSEAEALFDQALAFQDEHNPNSIQTYETRYIFAAMLADNGRGDDARRELEALDGAAERLPADHPLLQNIATLEQRLR